MEWEEFRAKLDRWKTMNQDQWGKSSAAPPLYLTLWKKKIRIKPPVLEHPLKLAGLMGLFWLTGSFPFLVFAVLLLKEVEVGLVIWLLGGLLFGSAMSVGCHVERNRRKLPKWEDI